MIRLKTVRFNHAVPAPGLPANHHSAQTQWQQSDAIEVQAEGAWVAIFATGTPIPRLIPVAAVDFSEPMECPKGFVAPEWKKPGAAA